MPLSVRVWDFMDRNFDTIGPDNTLGEAMLSISELVKSKSKSRSLVVVDEAKRPLGVISMRNILDAFKPEFTLWQGLMGKEGWYDAMEKGLRECNYRLVRDYMEKVPSLSMGDDIIKAYRILTEKNLAVRAVPVVEAGELAGIVRIPDLFQAFVGGL